MKKSTVSIGLPVYNGENYLREALDSLLSQSYSEFELIISDNASTDATSQICQEYALKDSRIYYFRQPQNIGGGPNFRFVFEKATGKYFKWAAHDDLMHKDFLKEHLLAFESTPSCLLAYPKFQIIDGAGNKISDAEVGINYGDKRAGKRFWSMLSKKNQRACEIFGLYRRSELSRYQYLWNFPNADRLLLGHLCLQGPFIEIQKSLFSNREHPARASDSLKSNREWREWFNPSEDSEKPAYYDTRSLWERFKSIYAAPISLQEKCYCYAFFIVPRHFVRFTKRILKELFSNLRYSMKKQVRSQ